MMDEVEDGRGSYIDIVRSIVPHATVPVDDVERDKIDLSDGPCYSCQAFSSRLSRQEGGRTLTTTLAPVSTSHPLRLPSHPPE
jgi:hypothetical protein